jgi:hypothetical protein
VFWSVPAALCGSPVLGRVKQVDLHQPCGRATDATHRPLLSIDCGGLADIAGKVWQGLGFPKDSARFLYRTMPARSPARPLGDVPFPHRAFPDPAPHPAGWPACLGPTAHGVPVYLKGLHHSSIMLHGAVRLPRAGTGSTGGAVPPATGPRDSPRGGSDVPHQPGVSAVTGGPHRQGLPGCRFPAGRGTLLVPPQGLAPPSPAS